MSARLSAVDLPLTAIRYPLTAIRCPLTAIRYPLSVEMVFPNEVIDFRLSDFRLWTA